jgi:hypothetical protein
MRWLASEQCAFDADATVHEYYWPSERLSLVPQGSHTDRALEQGDSAGGYGEPEPQS